MATTTVRPDGTVTVETGDAAKGAKAAATWDGETISARLVKSEAERRYSLHVVYPADKADIAKAQDGHRDFASKAVVEDAAWNYMRNHRQVGAFHTEEQAAGAGAVLKQTGAAEVVESYIYRGPDWKLTAADGSEQVVKSGDWLAGFIWTPEDWRLLQDGRIGGVSVEGAARRRAPSAEAIANLRD
jgi:hypothetical protein